MSIETGTVGAKSDQAKDRFFLGMRKSVDAAKRRATFVASTDEVDRQNEVISPAAFAADRERFLRGHTPFLAGHMGRSADGTPTQIGTIVELRPQKHHVEIEVVYAATELANEHWKLASDPDQSVAVSVGFMPHSYLRGTVAELRQQMPELAESFRSAGLKDSDPMLVWTGLELYEVSQVSVPANRGAIQLARKMLSEKLVPSEDAGPWEKAVAESLVRLLAPHVAGLQESLRQFQQAVGLDLEEIKSIVTDAAAERPAGGTRSAAGRASGVPAGDGPEMRELSRLGGQFLAELAKLGTGTTNHA